MLFGWLAGWLARIVLALVGLAVLGAIVFHLTPILTVKVPLPAFWLPPKLADRHADAIATTDSYLLRQAVFLVKLVAGLAWASHPEVRKRFALAPLEADPEADPGGGEDAPADA